MQHQTRYSVRYVAVLGVATCAVLLGACGEKATRDYECASGHKMGTDGKCHKICSTDDDCEGDQECKEKLCYDTGSIGGDNDDSGVASDPCTLCDFESEICVAGQCYTVCTSDNDCDQPSEECYLPGGFCVAVTSVKVRANGTPGFFESTSTTYTVRGGTTPFGVVSTSNTYRVTPPID